MSKITLSTILSDFGYGDCVIVYDGDIGVPSDVQAEHDAAVAHSFLIGLEKLRTVAGESNSAEGDMVLRLLDTYERGVMERLRKWGFIE